MYLSIKDWIGTELVQLIYHRLSGSWAKWSSFLISDSLKKVNGTLLTNGPVTNVSCDRSSYPADPQGFRDPWGPTVGDGTWNPWKSSLSTIYWMGLPDCPKDQCFRNSLYYIWVGKKPPNIFFLTQLLAPGGISRWRCGRRKGEWYSDASFAKAGECEECGEFVSWNGVGFFSVLLVPVFRIPFHYHNHGSVENGSLQVISFFSFRVMFHFHDSGSFRYFSSNYRVQEMFKKSRASW